MKHRLVAVAGLSLSLVASAAGQQGAATTKARELDSRHFMEYGGSPTIERLVADPANSGKELIVVTRSARDETSSGMHDGTLHNWLATRAANADLVVIAVPIRRHSALTSDHSFVFSDYDVQVERVLVDRSHSVRANRPITVARTGVHVPAVARPGLPEATEAQGFDWLGERVDEVLGKAGSA